MSKENLKHLLYSIDESIKDTNYESLIEQINKADKIVTIGAGRMGYAIKAFTMRLSHLGYNAFHLGDTTVPRTGENDLIIISTSSGETRSMKLYADIAKESKSTIVTVTHTPDSSIAKISDYVVVYKNHNEDFLMKTLAEASTYILYDIVALDLLKSKEESHVINNHSILE